MRKGWTSPVAGILRGVVFEILKGSRSFQKGGKLDQMLTGQCRGMIHPPEEMNCEMSRISHASMSIEPQPARLRQRGADRPALHCRCASAPNTRVFAPEFAAPVIQPIRPSIDARCYITLPRQTYNRHLLNLSDTNPQPWRRPSSPRSRRRIPVPPSVLSASPRSHAASSRPRPAPCTLPPRPASRLPLPSRCA